MRRVPNGDPDRMLRPLIGRLDQVCAADLVERVPDRVCTLVTDFLQSPHVLDDLATRPLPGAGPHGLYFDERGRFSIVLYEWAPGGRSPIHDHWCWGAVAGIRGFEREDRFALAPDGHAVWMATSIFHPGDTTAFGAGTVAIHRVACEGPIAARSLHVYGGDISRTNLSSIDRVYEEVSIAAPIVTAARR